jgi:hypothetical protein
MILQTKQKKNGIKIHAKHFLYTYIVQGKMKTKKTLESS